MASKEHTYRASIREATVGSKMNDVYLRIAGWDARDPWPLSSLGNLVMRGLAAMLLSWPDCYPPGIGKTIDNRDANNADENTCIKEFLLKFYSDVVAATYDLELPLLDLDSAWEKDQLPFRLAYAILLSNDDVRRPPIRGGGDVRGPPVRGGGGNTCMMCPAAVWTDEIQLAGIDDLSENTPVTVNLEVLNSNNHGGQHIVTTLSLLPGISSFTPRFCHFHQFEMKRLFKKLMAYPYFGQ